MDDGEYIFSHSIQLGHIHKLRYEKPELAFELGDTGQSLDDIEKQVLTKALEKTNFNQSQAAKVLKISRDTLRYRMKKHNLL